ncbi:unnamed protein product [Ostreobium quekettii]|uniref:Uncharacterized protein n=1 Tax=Ostreobium quekettii TaxID=121088 RepID=A0A8S1ING2_9CHLO|nr:unnamed protein product [Ostreobium quekettii]|eukprot:evm.model.scf_4.2 EVM.evm.TU.scf_4.2   scf_4:81902-83560(+)
MSMDIVMPLGVGATNVVMAMVVLLMEIVIIACYRSIYADWAKGQVRKGKGFKGPFNVSTPEETVLEIVWHMKWSEHKVMLLNLLALSGLMIGGLLLAESSISACDVTLVENAATKNWNEDSALSPGRREELFRQVIDDQVTLNECRGVDMSDMTELTGECSQAASIPALYAAAVKKMKGKETPKIEFTKIDQDDDVDVDFVLYGNLVVQPVTNSHVRSVGHQANYTFSKCQLEGGDPLSADPARPCGPKEQEVVELEVYRGTPGYDGGDQVFLVEQASGNWSIVLNWDSENTTIPLHGFNCSRMAIHQGKIGACMRHKKPAPVQNETLLEMLRPYLTMVDLMRSDVVIVDFWHRQGLQNLTIAREDGVYWLSSYVVANASTELGWDDSSLEVLASMMENVADVYLNGDGADASTGAAAIAMYALGFMLAGTTIMDVGRFEARACIELADWSLLTALLIFMGAIAVMARIAARKETAVHMPMTARSWFNLGAREQDMGHECNREWNGHPYVYGLATTLEGEQHIGYTQIPEPVNVELQIRSCRKQQSSWKGAS